MQETHSLCTTMTTHHRIFSQASTRLQCFPFQVCFLGRCGNASTVSDGGACRNLNSDVWRILMDERQAVHLFLLPHHWSCSISLNTTVTILLPWMSTTWDAGQQRYRCRSPDDGRDHIISYYCQGKVTIVVQCWLVKLRLHWQGKYSCLGEESVNLIIHHNRSHNLTLYVS